TLGASAALVGDPTPGFQTGDRNLAAGSNEVLCFRLSLPIGTGNPFQGAATTTTFTFDAEQTANNPYAPLAPPDLARSARPGRVDSGRTVMTRTLTWVRFSVAGLLGLGLLILAGTVAFTMAASLTGRETLVISGGSMQPAIPLGAVVLVQPVDPAAITVGDVISVQSLNGVVYTHRVAAVSDLNGQPAFQTKGDANETPEPAVVPATAVIGRVLF